MSKAPHPKQITPSSLENAALYYLERFSASAEQLRRVLMRRVERAARFHGDDPADGALLVDRLVARYLEAGVLDDRRYAEMRVAGQLRRGRPLRRIAGDLARRGVEGEVIDAALAAAQDEQAEGAGSLDAAAALAYAKRRRLGPFRLSERRAEYRERDLASLGRAGFSFDLARAVIDAEEEE